MGIPCSSSNKNREKNSFKEDHFKEYICKIKNDKNEVFGFFINFRYSDQNISIPTIIIGKDSFNENFNFEGNYFIKIYKNIDWFPINLKKIYIFNEHNIVILEISESIIKLNNISFLEIPDYDFMEDMNHYLQNGQYFLYYLNKEKIKFSSCLISNVDEKDYTFDYTYVKSKKVYKHALILKYNKKELVLVGIHMKKDNNKGVLIKGIIEEIKNYQKANKIDNNLNNICFIYSKSLSHFQEKEHNILHQNNNSNKNVNNENYINNDTDNLEVEDNFILNNLYTIQIEKNDFDGLNKKSSFKYDKNINYNNKLNNNNSYSSKIKQRSVDKRNLAHFEKVKNDNSEKIIDINNYNNTERNLNKSNNKDINKQIYKEKEKNTNLKDIKNDFVNNKIFEKKNDLKKQTQNKNEKTDKELTNIDNNGEIGKEISLYFIFNNGKELYLDVKDSCTFDQIIMQLNAKYLWLKNIKIKEYIINNKSICKNQTAKENKLVNNSKINIIEYS